jgi:3-hydroxybutyryl-CoA dehydrogenase
MTPLDPRAHPIGVVGAGAMGAGIALVAADAGHRVHLFDVRTDAVAEARRSIGRTLEGRLTKGRMTTEERDAVLERIVPGERLSDLAPAALVIEAVAEDAAIKRGLFAELTGLVGPEAILATNTSSLSVTALAAGLAGPERVCGMHFFNPAPVMPLVEVVSGLATAPDVAAKVAATARRWGKTPVACRSTPGFIVNRVARPFYGEAMCLAQEGAASVATLDALYRECGGFRMGPFELTDLIGQDINAAVTRSVFTATFFDPRYRPSLIQQDLVDAGWLGRKSGRGFYDYGGHAERPPAATAAAGPAPRHLAAEPGPALPDGLLARAAAAGLSLDGGRPGTLMQVDGVTLALTDGRTATQRARDLDIPALVLFDLAFDWRSASRIAIAAATGAGTNAVATAAGFFQALGFAVSVLDDVPGLAVMRTLAMLANEAAEALHQGVASAADIDRAMVLGVAYPAGPLAWAETVGLLPIVTVLDHLAQAYGDPRYRTSPLLRRLVAANGHIHQPV